MNATPYHHHYYHYHAASSILYLYTPPTTTQCLLFFLVPFQLAPLYDDAALLAVLVCCLYFLSHLASWLFVFWSRSNTRLPNNSKCVRV